VFITFRVERSDYFRREGSDIHTDAFISLSQATLGGSTRIQGLYENLTVDIPRGTSSHSRIRMKNKGVRRVNNFGYGDHYVHVKIQVPKKLSAKQEALLKSFAEVEDSTPGTINGIISTKNGTRRNVDETELLSKLRNALKDKELESSSTADLPVNENVEEQEPEPEIKKQQVSE